MARPLNNVVWLDKACSICEVVKPHTEFYNAPSRPGLKAECIECNMDAKKKYLKSSGHIVSPSNKPVQLAKNCTKCGELKSHTEFYKGKGRLTSQCKDCTDERLRTYHNENPHKREKFKTSSYNKNANYIKLYGITTLDAQKILDEQIGMCANVACGKELSFDAAKGAFNKAFVDHCHDTGKVRGILCIGCNTALGHLENKSKVFGLIQYLQKHGKSILS